MALDQFGQPFFFRLPDGRRDKRTCPGFVFTVLVTAAICFYAAHQFARLLGFGDTTIMVSKIDSYFDTDFEFATEDGLAIGFMLTAYDDEQESIEDPDYGRLVAKYQHWGGTDVPTETAEEVPTYPCTTEQLGLHPNGTLSGEPGQFYPVRPDSEEDVTYRFRKLRCFREERLVVHGDYNSARTRNLVLALELCDQEKRTKEGDPRRCKSDEEINRWLRGKYLVLYHNSRRFRVEEYGEGKIVEESRTRYIPLNSQLREDYVYKVQLTDLQLQDARFSISAFTQDDKRVFGINQVDRRPWDYEDRIVLAVTIEMDLDLQQINRQVYNILDWIGDIGGLGEGCFFISFTALGIVHFGALDNMIISELFRVGPDADVCDRPANSDRVGPAPTTTEHTSPEQPVSSVPPEHALRSVPKTSSLRQFLHHHLPRICLCGCLRRTKRERVLAQCREQYLKEIDIVEHIMQFREVRAELATKANQTGLQRKRSFFKRARTKVLTSTNLFVDGNMASRQQTAPPTEETGARVTQFGPHAT